MTLRRAVTASVIAWAVLALAAAVAERRAGPRGLRLTVPSAPLPETTARRVSAIDLRDLRADPRIPRGALEARWEGFWHVEERGEHKLVARSEGAVSLAVDGRPVFAGRPGARPRGTVALEPGFHALRVAYETAGGPDQLRLLWSSEGEPRRDLDARALFTDIPSGREQAWGAAAAVLGRLALCAALLALGSGVALVWRRRRLGPVLRVALPAAVVLYAAALRFEALVGRYGWEGPRWAISAARVVEGWHPGSLRWQPAEALSGGDPFHYLRRARAMGSFYEPDVREPLFPYATRVLLGLLDGRSLAVNAASAVFSTLLVLATYLLGAQAFSRAVGLGASLALAVDRDALWWGVEGFRDDAFAFLVVASALAFWRLWESPSTPRAVVAGLAGGAACLTRVTAVSFLVPLCVLFLVGRDDAARARRRALLPAVVVLAAVAGPFLLACALGFGDPFYAVNYHTRFYRSRSGMAYQDAMGWLEYLRAGFRPWVLLETGLRGLTVYPFANKWSGLDYLSPVAARLLAASSLAGLAMFAATRAGRLLLLVLFTALLPYAFTWTIPGGAEWRFTLAAYPFYLIAAWLALTRAAAWLAGDKMTARIRRWTGGGTSMGKPALVVLAAALAAARLDAAPAHTLRSPDGRTEVAITLGERVSYSVSRNGTTLLAPSPIALVLAESQALLGTPRLAREQRRSVDQTVVPVVREKRKEIRDRFNELTLTFRGGFGLVWRAYDNGVAYRWTTRFPKEITVVREEATFAFAPGDAVYFPEEEGFFSHNERRYPRLALEGVAGKLASLPVLVATRAGVKVWISEADLLDYAGLWLRGGENASLVATFPAYPAEEQQTSDRDVKVTKTAGFIARTRGTRAFPWRVLGLADQDGELLDNQLVYLLAEGTSEDFSWVRPGKVPWDWFNANNVYGVDFKSGVNTATYKHYVDFAARHGLEYLILDEGWSKPDDLLALNPEVDLPALLAYAREKGVGIVPWVIWLTLDKQFDAAFAQFERWGVAGLKVDFMQRDDQKMVNYYERVAKEAARRKLLIDFHGAYKPTGLRRRYPNLITREGVFGLEQNKWTDTLTPEHNVTLPFIRMVAGPMDYTPGAMVNANQKDFRAVFDRPMSQGTRCHQLAMYVIYESPLQMLADSPSHYAREGDAMDFLARVPTVWDETVVLAGKVGEYAALARRSASGEWYVGAMSDWTARELELDLSFLGEGSHRAEIWQDGVNAHRVGNDYRRTSRTVARGERLRISLAPGGGWVARIVIEPPPSRRE